MRFLLGGFDGKSCGQIMRQSRLALLPNPYYHYRMLDSTASALGTLALAATLAAGSAGDWPQFDLDARHSGASAHETVIHRGNVATLHSIYSPTLPAIADGAPAFLANVATQQGAKDLLFLTTKAGHVLALDAATGATVWSHRPATGPNYTTSSPAVDPGRQFVYSYALDGKVYKYPVGGDGTPVTTGGWPETATLKPDVEKGSSALSVVTANSGATYLYVANGGYPGDAGDYQGHITAIDLATGVQHVFNAACSDQTVHFVEVGNAGPDCNGHVQNAIWARAGVVYDSDNDKLFMATGNGDYDGNTGGHDWGDSVFALRPDGTGNGGNPVDAYTPTEFQHLEDVDADLGSTAPAILPAPAGSNVAHLGLQSGKDAQLRLLNLDNLSSHAGGAGPGHLGGELQKLALPQGGGVLTTPAAWVDPVDGSTWAFVSNGSGISGLQLTLDGAGNPSLVSRWTVRSGGSSPIVVNGLLFYAGSGNLQALDPRTGAQLWNSTSIGGIHWESPIVAAGHLYVTDESGKLWAFAPDPAPLGYFTVPPCRAIDTRNPTGTFGGPALQGNGAKRRFPLAGQCGIPADALAVAVNVTVVSPSGPGDLRLGPNGFAAPTSTINFSAGQVRSNNAILSLTGDPVGSFAVQTDIASGGVQLVVDVAGYFK
jgi:outer membrane protein assembly factor BamB